MISSLKELGLTEYEAKTYIALVAKSPLAVTDISQGADVPMSKIYGVLARLETGGWISVVPERPKKYRAINPRVAVDHACQQEVRRIEQSRDTSVASLGALFDQQSECMEEPEFQVIHGNINILNRFREITVSHKEGTMIHLAFVNPAAIKKVIGLVQGMPGEKQIFIIDDIRSLERYAELPNHHPGIHLIEAPERSPESIMFVYTDTEGLYCSLKDDEFVMALSIMDRGFLGMIRKFGEIAHPQIVGKKPRKPGNHAEMFEAHKAMLAGTAGKLFKHRKA